MTGPTKQEIDEVVEELIKLAPKCTGSCCSLTDLSGIVIYMPEHLKKELIGD